MLDILTRAGCFVAIIILGHVLRRVGFFGPETFSVLSKIVMKITLPAALLASSAGRPIDVSMLTISLLGLGGGALYMTLGWLLRRRENRQEQAFAMVNLAGYNVGTFALPFTQSFLGPVGVLTSSLFDVGNAFVCLGGSFGVARAVKEGGKPDFKRMLKAPLTSIPFLTHVVMVTLNLNGLKPPAAIISFAEILGGANAFLAMLMIGVGIRLPNDKSQIGAIVRILSVRFGIGIVLALCYYFLLPFDLRIRQTLVILALSPIGSAIPAYTLELEGDVGLSSAINSISIVISIVIIVSLLVVML